MFWLRNKKINFIVMHPYLDAKIINLFPCRNQCLSKEKILPYNLDSDSGAGRGYCGSLQTQAVGICESRYNMTFWVL